MDTVWKVVAAVAAVLVAKDYLPETIPTKEVPYDYRARPEYKEAVRLFPAYEAVLTDKYGWNNCLISTGNTLVLTGGDYVRRAADACRASAKLEEERRNRPVVPGR